MKTKALQVKTQMEIAKPVHQVFEAIVDPEKMSHYFISSGTDRMQDGRPFIGNLIRAEALTQEWSAQSQTGLCRLCGRRAESKPSSQWNWRRSVIPGPS